MVPTLGASSKPWRLEEKVPGGHGKILLDGIDSASLRGWRVWSPPSHPQLDPALRRGSRATPAKVRTLLPHATSAVLPRDECPFPCNGDRYVLVDLKIFLGTARSSPLRAVNFSCTQTRRTWVRPGFHIRLEPHRFSQ